MPKFLVVDDERNIRFLIERLLADESTKIDSFLSAEEAFGTAHRAHASNVGIAQYIPSVAGFLMEKEIKFIGGVTENPEKPYAVILGGAKVSDKIGVIRNLMNEANKIFIGGAMMFTFLKALDKEIGSSKFEEDKIDLAKELIKEAKEKNVELIDDIVDTAGSLTKAAKVLQDLGAKKVYACATHGVLSGPAIERIENSVIERLVITDTIPLSEEKQIDKIKVVSTAPLLADVIKRVSEGRSISKLFE